MTERRRREVTPVTQHLQISGRRLALPRTTHLVEFFFRGWPGKGRRKTLRKNFALNILFVKTAGASRESEIVQKTAVEAFSASMPTVITEI